MINVKAVNVDMDKIELLKKLVIENKGVLPYINLNEYNAYIGWVSDFNIQFVDGKQMQLDLKEEKDLFLLFVLAAVWSRSGRWENAAYFVTYLKYQQLDQVSEWNNKVFREKLKENRQTEAGHIAEYCKEIESRVKISFRKDIYDSIGILAAHWDEIKLVLKKAEQQNDYVIFIEYMRNIKGLGVNDNKMNIKILLILRELRCQNICKNIPGELCCVPDKRVENACKELGIRLPRLTSTRGLIKASSHLYHYFGDLYDIPTFGYEDLMK